MVIGTDFQWSSASASVNILKLFEGSLEQFLRNISEIREEAAQAANMVREYANVLALPWIHLRTMMCEMKFIQLDLYYGLFLLA